jgi:hypothetical protein
MLDARRPVGRLFFLLLSVMGLVLGTQADSGPVKTTISDVVYRADGTPATGVILVSWPTFTTIDAVTNRQIVDETKFKEGLGKVIDGTVECLNASIWAKPSQP